MLILLKRLFSPLDNISSPHPYTQITTDYRPSTSQHITVDCRP